MQQIFLLATKFSGDECYDRELFEEAHKLVIRLEHFIY